MEATTPKSSLSTCEKPAAISAYCRYNPLTLHAHRDAPVCVVPFSSDVISN